MIDVNDLMKKIDSSPEQLSKDNVNRIHEYLPVPNDWGILWAEIASYGSNPSGMVITDKGLVTKTVDHNKNMFNGLKKTEPDYIYQLIVWGSIDDNDINIKKEEGEKGVKYILEYGNSPIACFSSKSLYSYWEKSQRETKVVDENAATSGLYNANAQDVAFDAAYGAAQGNKGHGNFAEKAGVRIDRLNGNKTEWVGPDNRKDGADKIVNNKAVQCKYCSSASSSVSNCFRTNKTTGAKEFRYYDLNGKPMQVEVPKDQYEKAVESFERRIKKGEVPGVTDPAEARNIIRKGDLTYQQAKNLAKAGTVESITYDAVTGAINCSAIGGISALVSFGVTYWRTKDIKKAAENALSTGVKVFGVSFVGGILSAQLARTSAPVMLKPASDALEKALGYKNVQFFINSLRSLQGKGAISGVAASNSFVKALQANVISQGVFFAVFSAADTYRVMANKISGSQYAKNLVSLATGMVGAAASSVGAGAVAGEIGRKMGKKVHPKLGQVIGLAAGFAGGTVSSMAAHFVGNLFKEDDIVINARLINGVISNMAYDYLMDEDEISQLIELLGEHQKEIRKIQSKVRTYDYQYAQLYEEFRPYFEEIVGKREMIDIDKEAQMIENMDMALQPAF